MNISAGMYWDVPYNPIVGCVPCSEGCKRCWSAKLGQRQEYSDLVTNGQWNGQVRFLEKVLEAPLRWRVPRVVAVCWMGDWCHPGVSDIWIDRILRVIRACPQHTFLSLTKRPERLEELLYAPTMGNMNRELGDGGYLPNLWLGTSAENQPALDQRLSELFKCGPGWKYWVSLEPLLGPVDLTSVCYRDEDCDCRWNVLTGDHWIDNSLSCDAYSGPEDGIPHLDAVVLGGETGSGARPMHPDWVRRVRDDCAAARVPFYFKQWGEWAPTDSKAQIHRHSISVHPSGATSLRNDSQECGDMDRIGKKTAGRLLDGKQHNDLAWGKP